MLLQSWIAVQQIRVGSESGVAQVGQVKISICELPTDQIASILINQVLKLFQVEWPFFCDSNFLELGFLVCIFFPVRAAKSCN